MLPLVSDIENKQMTIPIDTFAEKSFVDKSFCTDSVLFSEFGKIKMI